MRLSLYLSVALLLVFPLFCVAQESSLSAQAELSVVAKSGNSDSESFYGKGNLSRKFSDSLTAKWVLHASRGEDDGVRSSESYGTELRLDHQARPQFYSFGFLGWFKDNFAGIKDRYILGGGAGYKILEGPPHSLSVEGGPNLTSEHYTDDSSRAYLAARFFAEYGYAFTEKNRFAQTVEFLYDFDDTNNYGLNSETGLIAVIDGDFSLKISYRVEYDHQPVPAILSSTDKVLSMALLADF